MPDAQPDTSTETVGRLLRERDAADEGFRAEIERTGQTAEQAKHYSTAIRTTSVLRALLAERDALRAQLVEARVLIRRYRVETPLGHQPHMIFEQAGEWLSALEETKPND